LPLIEQLAAGGDETSPIVIALHGLGDTPEAFINFIQPLVPGTRLIAVQAPLERTQGGYSWYRINSPHSTKDIQYAVRHVVATIDALRKRYPKAGLPTLIGFSQGAVISFSIAAKYNKLANAIVGIAGYLDTKPTISSPSESHLTHILVVHGQADKVIEYERGVRVHAALQSAGYQTDLLTHKAGHHVPGNTLTEIQHWLVTRLVQAR
jgi:phospholipase/carboxylesterase